MKKILVLGATGLIGVPLSNYLVRQGYNVIRHGNTSSADYQIDLTVPDNFLKILIEIDPDFIINLVALTDVDKCEAEPNLAYLLNIRPVEILQFYYNKKQSVKIIHISTDQVYDGTGPHRESDIKISNIYSLSKYYAEHVALGANGCILRTNFVGRSLKSQMRAANRYHAKYAVILGDDELSRGMVILRDMKSKEQQEIELNSISNKLSLLINTYKN